MSASVFALTGMQLFPPWYFRADWVLCITQQLQDRGSKYKGSGVVQLLLRLSLKVSVREKPVMSWQVILFGRKVIFQHQFVLK